MHNLLKSIVFSGLVALAVPAFAQIHLNINIGPPQPQREIVVEAPRAGVVWVPGYYVYDRSVERYMWLPGRWQAPPAPHQVWVAPRYVRNGNSYDYYEGRWGASRRSKGDNQNDNGNHHDNGKHKGRDKGEGNSGHGDKGR
jgi:hypothetical protein